MTNRKSLLPVVMVLGFGVVAAVIYIAGVVAPEAPVSVTEDPEDKERTETPILSEPPVSATAAVRMPIKENGFSYADEPSKPIQQVLEEMAGGGKKGPVIYMKSGDLGKKVDPAVLTGEAQRTYAGRTVPSPSDKPDAQPGILVQATVSHRIFRDEIRNYD